MRIVFDTNVLFAALVARKGVCANIIEICIIHHTIILSTHILDELRGHLAGKRKLSPDQIDSAVRVILDVATIVEPAAVPADACRDPDDLPVLGTALAAQVDVLVTGDDDLLVLQRFGSVPILSPRAFHTQYLVNLGG